MPLQTVVDAEALSLSRRHHVRVRTRDVAQQQYLDEAWRAGGDDKRLVLPRQLKVVHVHQRLLLWEFRRVHITNKKGVGCHVNGFAKTGGAASKAERSSRRKRVISVVGAYGNEAAADSTKQPKYFKSLPSAAMSAA